MTGVKAFNCVVCGRQFWRLKPRTRHKYCSDDCRRPVLQAMNRASLKGTYEGEKTRAEVDEVFAEVRRKRWLDRHYRYESQIENVKRQQAKKTAMEREILATRPDSPEAEAIREKRREKTRRQEARVKADPEYAARRKAQREARKKKAGEAE